MIDEFKAWMDAKKLRAEQVGERLNVSAQTIRNWRADAIPPRKHAEVRKLMDEWDDGTIDRIVLTPTPDQFDRWNRAANLAQQTIREWATEGLDQMAREWEQGKHRKLTEFPSSKVAEDGTTAEDIGERRATKYPRGGRAK